MKRHVKQKMLNHGIQIKQESQRQHSKYIYVNIKYIQQCLSSNYLKKEVDLKVQLFY